MGSKKVENESLANVNENDENGMVESMSEPVDDRTESPRSSLKSTNNFFIFSFFFKYPEKVSITHFANK